MVEMDFIVCMKLSYAFGIHQMAFPCFYLTWGGFPVSVPMTVPMPVQAPVVDHESWKEE